MVVAVDEVGATTMAAVAAIVVVSVVLLLLLAAASTVIDGSAAVTVNGCCSCRGMVALSVDMDLAIPHAILTTWIFVTGAVWPSIIVYYREYWRHIP